MVEKQPLVDGEETLLRSHGIDPESEFIKELKKLFPEARIVRVYGAE